MDVAEAGSGLVDRPGQFLDGLASGCHDLDGGLAAVVEVEKEGLGDDILHIDMVDEDVADHAAAAACALETEADVSAEEAAVGNLDVLHPA